MIVQTSTIKSLLASLYKGRHYPSLAKRGEGRFSAEYVFSASDPLTTPLPQNAVTRKTAIMARFVEFAGQ